MSQQLSVGRHRQQPVNRVTNGKNAKLSLALGLCLCAGQLIGVSPASAAPVATAPVAAVSTTLAGTATATPTAALASAKAAAVVTPRMRISVSTHNLVRGRAVVVHAKVTDPRTGKAVNGGVAHLQAWRNGGWRTWQAKKVVNGLVRYTAKPGKFAGFRVVYRGLGGTYRVAFTSSKKVAVTAPASSSKAARIISEVKKHVGKPYVWAAAGPRAFDCSGLTKYVYKKVTGKSLPHKANEQQRKGRSIAKSQAKPGDLIFFRHGSYAYHVGIYAGNGYMYDAPRPGKSVGKHKIWSKNYVVRRLV